MKEEEKEYQEHYSPDGERIEYLMEHPEESPPLKDLQPKEEQEFTEEDFIKAEDFEPKEISVGDINTLQSKKDCCKECDAGSGNSISPRIWNCTNSECNCHSELAEGWRDNIIEHSGRIAYKTPSGGLIFFDNKEILSDFISSIEHQSYQKGREEVAKELRLRLNRCPTEKGLGISIMGYIKELEGLSDSSE